LLLAIICFVIYKGIKIKPSFSQAKALEQIEICTVPRKIPWNKTKQNPFNAKPRFQKHRLSFYTLPEKLFASMSVVG